MTTTGITKNNLNLREQGSTDATIIKTLPAGTTVNVLGGVGTAWLYVTAPDASIGYVSSVYVTLTTDTPATTAAPASPATPPAPVSPTSPTAAAAPSPSVATDPTAPDVSQAKPAPVTTPTLPSAITPTTAAAPVAPAVSGSARPLTPLGEHGQMVNIRAQATINGTLLGQVSNGDALTPLESDASVAAKMGTSATQNQWINVTTPDGKTGFIAAWLTTYWTVPPAVSTPVGPALSADDYIVSIPPDESPVPQDYHDFWAQRVTLGLPAPFEGLPAQLPYPQIAHTGVNGFGPNQFSFHNWPQWYTHVDGMHNGLDLIIPTDTPLLAVADGVIVGTEQDWPFLGSSDKCIILWCYLPPSVVDSQGNRMLSNLLVAYAHLSDNGIVKRQAVVRAGDVIGMSGFPGNQPDNAHLHLETHLLSGDNNLPVRSGRRLLADYANAQPFDNRTPFNPLLFFSERLVRYYMHQGRVLGYDGGTTYPTSVQLAQNGLAGWAAAGFVPDFFSLGYYQYDDTLIIWNQKALPFPNGLYDLPTTNRRITSFTPFKPYPADFLRTN